MSWPLGYTNPGLAFRATLDGTVFAQGVRVTEPRGWLVVAIPEGPSKPGTVEVAVRVRLSVDSHGHPFLYAEQVACKGKEYPGVHALINEFGAEWVEPLRRCVFSEIARRAQDPLIVRRQSRTMQAVQPSAVTQKIAVRTADETWDPVDAPIGNSRRR
jgi:hypothetical protein